MSKTFKHWLVTSDMITIDFLSANKIRENYEHLTKYLLLDTTIINQWCKDARMTGRTTCYLVGIALAMERRSWDRPWRRHQMETFSALLGICAWNSSVPGEFPTKRPVTRSFDVYFDLRPNKRLSKQSWGWWFEMPSRPLWRHRNAFYNHKINGASLTNTISLTNFGIIVDIRTYIHILCGILVPVSLTTFAIMD